MRALPGGPGSRRRAPAGRPPRRPRARTVLHRVASDRSRAGRWCMIRLPTSVTSRTSRRSISAARASSAVSFARHPRTALVSSRSEPGVEHRHVGDPAREVAAEPDLGVHLACRCEHLAGEEIAEMTGDVVEPMSKAMPKATSCSPGLNRGDRALVMDGDRHGTVPVPQRGCSSARTWKSTPSAGRSHSEASASFSRRRSPVDSPSSASTSST